MFEVWNERVEQRRSVANVFNFLHIVYFTIIGFKIILKSHLNANEQ